MPTDASFPLRFNDAGDIEQATGEDFYHRHALQLGLIAAENTKGSNISPEGVAKIRRRTKYLMEQSPWFEGPIIVKINDITENTINLKVDVNELDNFKVTI